jgi:hypothetical protein
MRRSALAVLAVLAATAFATPPANASIYCTDLGPLPGYGPVCTVKCLMTVHPEVNPKNVGETLGSFIVQCPA